MCVYIYIYIDIYIYMDIYAYILVYINIHRESDAIRAPGF